MDFLLAVLMGLVCAYAAHEGVRWGNRQFRELDMSPNWAAIIACFFGLTGILVLAVYGAAKVMIKRMIKR